MSKFAATVQIVLMLVIVIFSTYHFYRGNFELAYSTLPILMLYYVIVFGRSRRLPPPDSDAQHKGKTDL